MLNKLTIGAVVAVLTAYGCGRSDSSAPAPELNDEAGGEGWVDVVVNIDNPDDNAALQLAAADSYAADITDCLSGYTKALTEADASINVQDGDFNCEFQLSSLVYGGETFTFSGDNWAASSSFDKTGSSGTLMNFTIVSQIDSPVSGAQSVTIIFGAAEEGSSQAAAADISTGISIVGADDLGLSVSAFDVLVDATDGAGRFYFDLECDAAMVGADAAATCNDEVLEGLAVRIAADTYGASLTLDECRSHANGTGTTVGDASGSVGSNGGLDIDALKGPAALYTPANANLLMAVAGPDADSGCKYWRVSITAP